ncbi:SPFH domain-containing protein [Planobispora takensis]|uniref:Band 7 domain-containing protein n=1 Tax=Planobispora takensis TaxID=1367882 RepID=A0A8J3SVG8_9ACTN|nr:SPFH domain-containing protein [Planobispora takensis]GII00396.1 hypothetical protein Pta02_24040 [Planobispora takensis]
MIVLGTGPQAGLSVEALPAWIVAGTVALAGVAVVALSSVRLLASDERLVLLRRGRPARVGGPGVVFTLPVLERGVRVSLRPICLDLLWLEAETRDGVAVTVSGAALASVRDPVRYGAAGDSVRSALTAAVEAEVRRYVAGCELAELAAPPGDRRRNLPSDVTAGTRQWGVEVTGVEIHRIEVPLSAGLIQWAEAFTPHPRQDGPATVARRPHQAGPATAGCPPNRCAAHDPCLPNPSNRCAAHDPRPPNQRAAHDPRPSSHSRERRNNVEIIRTTIPGTGTVHHLTARSGHRFGVLVDDAADQLCLLVYGLTDPDTPAQCIVMERDEAGQLAEILQVRPLADRIADLEHRLTELTGAVP